MKKILLASTALVGAGALFAAASQPAQAFEVRLGGTVELEVRFSDNEDVSGEPDRGYAFKTDGDFAITGSDTSDTGILYGFRLDFIADGGDDDVAVDEAGLFFEGGFGRLELGSDDGAEDVMYLSAQSIAAGTGGIDGTLSAPDGAILIDVTDSSDATKVTYFTPRVAGFQFGVSFTPDTGDGNSDVITGDSNGDAENHVGVGLNYVGTFGGLDLGIAAVGSFGDFEGEDTDLFDDDEGDLESYAIGGTVGFAGLTFGAGYVHDEFADVDADAFDLGVAYGFGPVNTSLTGNYVDADDGGDSYIVVLSGDVQVLPGVTLRGDLAYTDFDTDADDDFFDDDDDEDAFSGIFAVLMSF